MPRRHRSRCEHGGRVLGYVADVGDQAALREWVTTAAEALGGVDIVVANVSALAIPDSAENWQRAFEVDMMGTVGLVQAAMPYLERSPSASIVTIASVSGREIDFAAGPYGTFKAAIIHYTQGLAFQLAPKGIRANSLSPGNTYFPGGVWENIEQNNPSLFATALGLNPTGRMASPQEIARARGLSRQPRGQLHHRRQPPRRRRAHPRRPVLNPSASERAQAMPATTLAERGGSGKQYRQRRWKHFDDGGRLRQCWQAADRLAVTAHRDLR